MKKYRAETAISVSATLPKGGSARISFMPLSDGSSVYYTDDPELQWALEHHHRYGKMFKLESASGEKAPKPKKPTQKNAKKETKKCKASEADKLNEAPENEEAGTEEPELKEVTVSDVDDAKDYLAEHFEVVRTKMKSEETINATARSFGIIFKYL